MNKNQVATVNLITELILAPISIIPTLTTRPSKRVYYKDTITQKRYAVKIEGTEFNVREELINPWNGKAYRFGSRTLFRTIDDDKKLSAALLDFKEYVMKHRNWYIKISKTSVAATEHSDLNS